MNGEMTRSAAPRGLGSASRLNGWRGFYLTRGFFDGDQAAGDFESVAFGFGAVG